jgi:hypothetical protein
LRVTITKSGPGDIAARRMTPPRASSWVTVTRSAYDRRVSLFAANLG